MTENKVASAGTSPDIKTGNGTSDSMRLNATDEDSSVLESGAKYNMKAEHGAAAAAGVHSSPKKRRKVNHGKGFLLQG